MIWVAGRSPTLVSHSLRGVAMNLKATTLTYLAIPAGLALGVVLAFIKIHQKRQWIGVSREQGHPSVAGANLCTLEVGSARGSRVASLMGMSLGD